MRLSVLSLVLTLVAFGVPASGTVLLKPTGSAAQPLRARSITASAVIDGQVAATEMVLRFANASEDRLEADFLYELPPNAVPTYFAYWYGQEKVVARIAEKERAQQIYHYITARMRDPALVEMKDERTLRARIFPVMPNSDLRVEVHFVQAVPSVVSQAAVYTLPLEQPEGDTLEEIDVTVRVKGRVNLFAVTNNYGLPVETQGSDTLIRLGGRNYRPAKDLRVQQQFDNPSMQASLYAAPSGGPDGFFVLALTPMQTLQRPKIRIDGVQVYDLTPLPASVKAHESLFLCGRYRGSGTATVTLSGAGAGGMQHDCVAMRFGARAVPENPASKLWAARRMAALSAAGKNARLVTILSHRFNIPGKYTSWIAIPREERARYRREQAMADAAVLARKLTQMITTGRGDTRAARTLRMQLKAKCKSFGVDAQELLRSELYSRTYQLANDLAWLVQRGQEAGHEAGRVRHELRMLARHSGQDAGQLVREHLWASFSKLAQQIVDERHRPEPNTRALARWQREWDRLVRATGGAPQGYLEYAEREWVYREAERTRAHLIVELGKASPNPGQLEKLKTELLRLFTSTEYSAEAARVRLERLVARVSAERLERRMLRLQEDGTPVPEMLLAQAVQQRRREDELRVRMGDPLITADAPADARSVTALLPGGEVKPLHWHAARQRWEARFDVPAHVRSGEYRITIIAVLKDGSRRMTEMPFTVDLTPPVGTVTARVLRDPARLLRLDLQASADTARATAVLPWGARVDLLGTAPGCYFALIPLPEGQSPPVRLDVLLTDRAHNRAVLTATAEEE